MRKSLICSYLPKFPIRAGARGGGGGGTEGEHAWKNGKYGRINKIIYLYTILLPILHAYLTRAPTSRLREVGP